MGLIGIDPRYYWYEMSMDEVVAVLKANDESIKRQAEQVRLQCFYSATVMGNKTDDGRRIDRPDKLFKLPWDDEVKKAAGPVVTRTKEEALAALAEMRKNKQNGK